MKFTKIIKAEDKGINLYEIAVLSKEVKDVLSKLQTAMTVNENPDLDFNEVFELEKLLKETKIQASSVLHDFKIK